MTKTNKFNEIVFDNHDMIDLIMSGHNLLEMGPIVVDNSIALEPPNSIDVDWPHLQHSSDSTMLPGEFHYQNQQCWHMPREYQDLDIAAYILGLCKTDSEIQRVGQELLLFQERDLFNLLKYLHYLVNVLKENNIIWGVGRGSSVASYVLYLLGVHRIDSMYYDLDPTEFLR